MKNNLFNKKKENITTAPNKIKIGIDIDEVIRAKWLQFDRYYNSEFGDETEFEAKYTNNFFKDYPWKEITETVNYLKDEIPDISPIDYQLNDNGKCEADNFLFNKETVTLSKEDVYKRFLYEDYLFEIFGSAPQMYRNIDLDLNKFCDKYSNDCEITIFSREEDISISPTLFFLSKFKMKFRNYFFIKKYDEVIDKFNLIITANPEITKVCDKNNIKHILLSRPYNSEIKTQSLTYLHVNDLIDNELFESLLNEIKNGK
jgi:hypothetical protein